MARGKHSSLAANRRYEASVDHIDRLTNELVEAKERARRYQREAESVPALQAKIAELTAHVEAGTSAELDKARSQVVIERDLAHARVSTVAKLLMGAIERAKGALYEDEWARLIEADVNLAEVSPEFSKTRTARRNSARMAGRKASENKQFMADAGKILRDGLQ